MDSLDGDDLLRIAIADLQRFTDQLQFEALTASDAGQCCCLKCGRYFRTDHDFHTHACGSSNVFTLAHLDALLKGRRDAPPYLCLTCGEYYGHALNDHRCGERSTSDQP